MGEIQGKEEYGNMSVESGNTGGRRDASRTGDRISGKGAHGQAGKRVPYRRNPENTAKAADRFGDTASRHAKRAKVPQGGVPREKFLPVSKKDMEERGIAQLDFVYVTGDAYVDHPSFGPAIISRVLESRGFSVGIIAQPDWKNEASVMTLGRPRLAFLVSAGNMDSMVNHYSVSRKHRQEDAYTPGGVMGRRPDRAAMVYCNLIRKAFRDVPIIAGGIEASLRRLAHYDYWEDKLRRSLLMDCGADLISYGMGEHSIVEIAEALDSGLKIGDITFVPGTCYKTKCHEDVYDYIMLPSWEELQEDRLSYARSFRTQMQNTDPFNGHRLVEPYGSVWVVQNPPAKPLTQQEMDDVYALPYAGTYHPDYIEEGGIPALEEVRFSIISNRGCYGACSFCALTFHQGRIIQTRSDESIIDEARRMTRDPLFKGYIHDVGGPTANFHQPSCDKQLTKGVCPSRECLWPEPCRNLKVTHEGYTNLLKKLRELPGVKKVFVRSGVRFDYVVYDKKDDFLKELVKYHISGQLKVAPEHISDNVLYMMGKPKHSVYLKFADRYNKMNRSCSMDQYLVPYMISSHPGCTMKDAIELAEYLRDIHHQPEQVQDFYPTPSTVSTVMYYTGVDPRTMKPVYVPRDPHEKAMQRALMQYKNPKFRGLVEEALKAAGREDLIGYDRKCLIRPAAADPERHRGSRGSYPESGRGENHDSKSHSQAGRQPGDASRMGRGRRG